MRWLLLLLLCLPLASAATIYGSVYDFGLDKVDKAIVTLDTVPSQTVVASNGSYRFEVPEGDYVLTASKGDSIISENITVAAEGNYVIDLILLPDLSVEESLMDPDLGVEDVIIPEDEPRSYWPVVIAVLAGLVVLVVFFLRKKSRPSALGPELSKIVEFVRKEGGRCSQKDIYRSVPWSESKVSLMLDDLESRGIIRRVKKGRSKLVFLK